MESRSSWLQHSKGVVILLRTIDIYCKYAKVVSLKDKKGITMTNAFQTILDKSRRHECDLKDCKPNRICIYKGNEFYNTSVKSWLQDNGIEMYSRHNEKKKSAVAERFIITFKNKIYKNICLW